MGTVLCATNVTDYHVNMKLLVGVLALLITVLVYEDGVGYMAATGLTTRTEGERVLVLPGAAAIDIGKWMEKFKNFKKDFKKKYKGKKEELKKKWGKAKKHLKGKMGDWKKKWNEKKKAAKAWWRKTFGKGGDKTQGGTKR